MSPPLSLNKVQILIPAKPTLLEIYSRDTIVNCCISHFSGHRSTLSLLFISLIAVPCFVTVQVGVSSARFSHGQFQKRNVQRVFAFLIGPVHMLFTPCGVTSFWGPVILHYMIDSCPWLLRRVSQQNQWMLWSCEGWAAALIYSQRRCKLAVVPQRITVQSHKGNYPSMGVRGRWSDFSTSELHMVQRIRTSHRLLPDTPRIIHRAFYNWGLHIVFLGVNCVEF